LGCTVIVIDINREEKRDAIDVRLCDFDDTAYRVIVDAKERDTLRVSCYPLPHYYHPSPPSPATWLPKYIIPVW
jgi:hypothetical protein